MNKYFNQTLYFFLLLVSIFSPRQSFATHDANTDETFNYSQTVALILKTENGGYIFQRPEQDDPITAFVPAFAITYKYTSQMQPIHAGLALDMESLQPQHSFLLVNHQSTKLLYLGDHWLGDDKSFAVMEAADYQNLKNIFESRMRVSKPTTEEAQQAYIKSIHDLWQEDSEEFYRRYYFPERNTLIHTSSASAHNNPSLPARNFTQQNNTSQESTSETTKDVRDSTSSVSSVKNLETSYKDFQTGTISNAGDTNNLRHILLLTFILVLTAVYWWWRKRK